MIYYNFKYHVRRISVINFQMSFLDKVYARKCWCTPLEIPKDISGKGLKFLQINLITRFLKFSQLQSEIPMGYYYQNIVFYVDVIFMTVAFFVCFVFIIFRYCHCVCLVCTFWCMGILTMHQLICQKKCQYMQLHHEQDRYILFYISFHLFYYLKQLG